MYQCGITFDVRRLSGERGLGDAAALAARARRDPGVGGAT